MIDNLPSSRGATGDEIAREYLADELAGPGATALTRAVAVSAPSELAYRWLCQIALHGHSLGEISS